MKKYLEKIKNLNLTKKIKDLSLSKKIIYSCVLAVVIVSVALVCTVNAYMDRINFIDEKFEYITDESLQEELDVGELVSFDEPDTKNSTEDTSYYEEIVSKYTQESTEEVTLPEFEFKEGITNILLIGADRQGTNGYGRSDTIMILTLDTNEKTIKLSSVLRDCYVTIPGYSQNKINASYAFGGPDLLIETLEANFGIKLDKYVYIDFEDFTNIIETLGGVDMELTAKETSVIWGFSEAGIYHLNSKEALHYVRIRKIDSDFGRTDRQRKLMMSIYNEFKAKPLTELVPIATEIFQYVNTNMTKTEILDLLSTAVTLGDLEIKTQAIPEDKTYVFGRTSAGASIIVVDFEQNSKILYEFIYGEPYEEKIQEEAETLENEILENTEEYSEYATDINENNNLVFPTEEGTIEDNTQE